MGYCEHMFSRFGTIPARGKRTDRWTDMTAALYHASMVSCSKNAISQEFSLSVERNTKLEIFKYA